MTPEQERWAEALMIERLYGKRASNFIALRLKALRDAGDEAGAERFTAIEVRLRQLRAGGRPS